MLVLSTSVNELGRLANTVFASFNLSVHFDRLQVERRDLSSYATVASITARTEGCGRAQSPLTAWRPNAKLLETIRALNWQIVILIGTLVAASPIVAQTLPSTATSVKRAQGWVSGFTETEYRTLLGEYAVIWDNLPESPQGGSAAFWKPANTVQSSYTSINRIPKYSRSIARAPSAAACGGGSCSTAWFQNNHPSWVIYKRDKVTPAYQFSDIAWAPLDISNLAVQQFFKDNIYTPLYAYYDAISIDNVTAANFFGEAGTCSIKPTTNCTTDGGVWTELYNGAAHNDTAFINARVSWLQAITAHAHAAGKMTIGNIFYDSTTDPTLMAQMVNAVDVWFDEPGFTGDDWPSKCGPSASKSASKGANWIRKVTFTIGLNGGAGPLAYISNNSICPVGSFWVAGEGSAFESIEYAVASYLLVKNSYSYIIPYFASAGNLGTPTHPNLYGSTVEWPQLSLEHGAASSAMTVTGNVYHRTFANALALVNPSTTTDYNIALGGSVYYRSDCTRFTGTITVKKTTGMVLLNRPPSSCVP